MQKCKQPYMPIVKTLCCYCMLDPRNTTHKLGVFKDWYFEEYGITSLSLLTTSEVH